MAGVDGAIDIHVHAGPSYFDRKHDAIDLAELYADAGMRGFVLKSHFGDTHKPARMAAERVPSLEVYSSITLNSFVGGFNPTAVEHALETGARVVWLPTFSAANFDPSGIGRGFPFSNQSLTALEDGTLRPDVRDVLETLADHDEHVALGNGHLAPEESVAVLDAMEEMGLSIPYLVTHADFGFMGLSLEDQLEMADRGAIVEKCYLPVLHGDVSLAELASSIEAIGPDRCVLSTDHGQADNESPPDAYGSFVDELRATGLDADALEAITAGTPTRLLGIDRDE
ncbi:DUF6282 family protein [Natrinema caseinilyticum]|uniref:DUF6282 family protein n=1 Tax=Natrinema caseinilyticum TaxID=2961570 RepID=UPI0020C3B2F4|nr:DUF6282 family protein [Natrinema caseinilyticum]